MDLCHSSVGCEWVHVIQDLVMNGFMSALRRSGQDHVANIYIFSRENNKVIMSREHYELLRTKRPSLCDYLNARDCFSHSRISPEIFSEADRGKVLRKAAGPNDMADRMIESLLRKSDDAFRKFVALLRESRQPHVAYILTGEGNSRPLKEEHRQRLLSEPRGFVVQKTDSKHSGLITTLMDKGVFSSHDEQRITSVQPGTHEDRNETILNLIARKSQTDFVKFISALNDTDQTHIVVALIGANVVAKIRTIYDSEKHGGHGVDAELLEYMREMLQRNGEVTPAVRRLNETLSHNGVSVFNIKQGCIEITFTCKDRDSLRNFRNLNVNGELENMLNKAFCPKFAKKGLKCLHVEISNDQFDQFTRWKPMTSEHREALLSSTEFLLNKVTVRDSLLDKLSLCPRRREAIESASTREQQVKTLIDIVSRQPDSAFTQLINALNHTQQIEAANIIRGDFRNERKNKAGQLHQIHACLLKVITKCDVVM